ncbi:hypothetical protein MLD38_012767 [Melastoma candidum]|uniref:Uncharacterized protein n=1 Tax=Melastoma candidum TaxID=119954 RepID=A0ACB9R7D4_9MYRT|nr:hypothetical protein MLD38_012767 [Melastoma candidum]
MIGACVGGAMRPPEEQREEEVAVFTDTNVGTRLAVSVPSGITVADFKRVLERAHFACFPDHGEITVEGVMVRRKSCLYCLPSLVPLKCFFRKKQSSYDQGGEYDIVENEKSSCQRLLPLMASNEACNLREQKKRKVKKEQHMEHLSKKMEDDPVANVKSACVENSSTISSDILSVGDGISRGLKSESFSDPCS